MLNERDAPSRSTGPEDSCATSNCLLKRVSGSDYCQRHGAHIQITAAKRAALYDIAASHFLASDNNQEAYKYDLSAELGVSRTILQKYLDKVTDDTTLVLHNGAINQQIDRIQKLCETILKADVKLGTLMSEDDATAIAQGLLDAVTDCLEEHIKGKADFAAATIRIGERFQKILNERTRD